MSAFGLALVVAAAFCHATWNLLVKKIGGGAETVWLFSSLSALIYAPLALFVALRDASVLSPIGLGFVAGSAALHTGYFLLLQRGYREGDLSLVYPTARATGPLVSVTFALLFLGERLTAGGALGALLVIGGVLGLTRAFDAAARAKNAEASLAFGVATGGLIGCYTVWDAHAVSALAVPPLLLDFGSNAVRAALLTPHALRHRGATARRWREHRAAIVGVAVFSPLAYILVLYAMTFTPVAYVAPARELSVLVAVLMGSVLLKEGDLPHRLRWAAVILAGVALLAAG